MQSVLARLHEQSAPPDIFGLQGASVALFLSRAAETLQSTICCLLPADEQIDSLSQDIAFFSSVPVLAYPSFEIPPYTPLSPDPATVCTRLATLCQLHDHTGPCILLCSVESSLRRVIPAIELDRRSELLITGEETDREALISTLLANGYQRCDMVRQEGDMALRGGIIDVYPPPFGDREPGPLRLDFFGDTVESIRLFDTLSQRSRKELKELVLIPATDLLFPNPNQSSSVFSINWMRKKKNRTGPPQNLLASVNNSALSSAFQAWKICCPCSMVAQKSCKPSLTFSRPRPLS